MAGKISVKEANDPDALDWEQVEKMNALMDMEDDYNAAYREFTAPENKG